MAIVYTSPNDTAEIFGPARIYGNSGRERAIIHDEAHTVELSPAVEEIHLARPAYAYQFRAASGSLEIWKEGAMVVRIPASSGGGEVRFADGAARFSANPDSGEVSLGGRLLSTLLESVAPILDASRPSSDYVRLPTVPDDPRPTPTELITVPPEGTSISGSRDTNTTFDFSGFDGRILEGRIITDDSTSDNDTLIFNFTSAASGPRAISNIENIFVRLLGGADFDTSIIANSRQISVFGGTATDRVLIDAGARNVTLASGVDEGHFTRAVSAYRFRMAQDTAEVLLNGALVAKISANEKGSTLCFADGGLSLEMDALHGRLILGGQTLQAAAAAYTGNALDPRKVSLNSVPGPTPPEEKPEENPRTIDSLSSTKYPANVNEATKTVTSSEGVTTMLDFSRLDPNALGGWTVRDPDGDDILQFSFSAAAGQPARIDQVRHVLATWTGGGSAVFDAGRVHGASEIKLSASGGNTAFTVSNADGRHIGVDANISSLAVGNGAATIQLSGDLALTAGSGCIILGARGDERLALDDSVRNVRISDVTTLALRSPSATYSFKVLDTNAVRILNKDDAAIVTTMSGTGFMSFNGGQDIPVGGSYVALGVDESWLIKGFSGPTTVFGAPGAKLRVHKDMTQQISVIGQMQEIHFAFSAADCTFAWNGRGGTLVLDKGGTTTYIDIMKGASQVLRFTNGSLDVDIDGNGALTVGGKPLTGGVKTGLTADMHLDSETSDIGDTEIITELPDDDPVSGRPGRDTTFDFSKLSAEKLKDRTITDDSTTDNDTLIFNFVSADSAPREISKIENITVLLDNRTTGEFHLDDSTMSGVRNLTVKAEDMTSLAVNRTHGENLDLSGVKGGTIEIRDQDVGGGTIRLHKGADIFSPGRGAVTTLVGFERGTDKILFEGAVKVREVALTAGTDESIFAQLRAAPPDDAVKFGITSNGNSYAVMDGMSVKVSGMALMATDFFQDAS